jgi:hypothetical protein
VRLVPEGEDTEERLTLLAEGDEAGDAMAYGDAHAPRPSRCTALPTRRAARAREWTPGAPGRAEIGTRTRRSLPRYGEWGACEYRIPSAREPADTEHVACKRRG